MSDYFTNLVINSLLMFITIYSVKELYYDKSIEGSFFKKTKRIFWIFVSMAFIVVGFNFIKDCSAETRQESLENEKRKADSNFQASQRKLQASQEELKDLQQQLLKLQLTTKDTILNKVDSTYVNSIKASNEALAKYNLKITDSLHSVISRLKLDATHPQLIVAPSAKGYSPAFLIKENGVNKLKIQFNSVGGTSYHVLLNYYFLKEDSQRYVLLDSGSLSLGQSFTTEITTTTKEITVFPKFLIFPEIIVFLTGSFSKDPEGNVTVPFNYAFKFNLKENIFLGGWEMHFDEVKKFLNIK